MHINSVKHQSNMIMYDGQFVLMGQFVLTGQFGHTYTKNSNGHCFYHSMIGKIENDLKRKNLSKKCLKHISLGAKLRRNTI
jgi:hypothetical protein